MHTVCTPHARTTMHTMHNAHKAHTTPQAIVFAGCELALTICLTVHFTTPNMISRNSSGLSLRNGDLDPTSSHVYLLIWTAAALWYAPISPSPPPSRQPSPSFALYGRLILARYELQQMGLALNTTESKSRDKKQSVWRNFLKYLNYDPFNLLDLSALST